MISVYTQTQAYEKNSLFLFICLKVLFFILIIGNCTTNLIWSHLILGMAVARDIKGKRERIVTVINNLSTMTGQIYEAMSNVGYLDSNMIVILNDSRHSLHPKLDDGSKTSVSALSSTLSRLQSSKSFRKFREAAKVFFWFFCFNWPDTWRMLFILMWMRSWCLFILF